MRRGGSTLMRMEEWWEYSEMSEFLHDWGLLLASTLLLLVTGWYAWLTLALARASKDAAASAASAAEHARASVSIAMANTRVAFRLHAYGHSFSEFDSPDETTGLVDHRGSLYTVELTCDGAAVVVHEVLLIAAWVVDSRVSDGEGEDIDSHAVGEWPAPLEPAEDTELPAYVHDGEAAWFEFEDGSESPGELSVLKVDVRYSFNGATDIHTRRVSIDELGIPGWREGTQREPREPGAPEARS